MYLPLSRKTARRAGNTLKMEDGVSGEARGTQVGRGCALRLILHYLPNGPQHRNQWHGQKGVGRERWDYLPCHGQRNGRAGAERHAGGGHGSMSGGRAVFVMGYGFAGGVCEHLWARQIVPMHIVPSDMEVAAIGQG